MQECSITFMIFLPKVHNLSVSVHKKSDKSRLKISGS